MRNITIYADGTIRVTEDSIYSITDNGELKLQDDLSKQPQTQYGVGTAATDIKLGELVFFDPTGAVLGIHPSSNRAKYSRPVGFAANDARAGDQCRYIISGTINLGSGEKGKQGSNLVP